MTCKLRGENWYTWYSAIILMLCYAVGELGHYLLGVISRPMAQDVEFGDQGCLTNNSVVEEMAGEKCKGINNQSVCSSVKFNETFFCEWNYLGSGFEYQILAGPAFIAIFTVTGVILGVIGDKYNRVRLLTICTIIFSLMLTLTGLSTEYWHLIVLRFGFGAGEAGCTPLTASLVADMFGDNSRSLAMAIFNWGIYVGYGLAYPVGNYVPEANILGQGWRWAYYIIGIPGFVMAAVLFITVKEPKRKDVCVKQYAKKDIAMETDAEINSDFKSTASSAKDEQIKSVFKQLWQTSKTFVTDPVILILLLGASIRHTASFCWSYNTQLYFDQYHPNADLGIWMFLCSTIGGSIGIATGGIISDLIASKYGISMRLWVLVGSQAVASPLAAMVLYLDPPYCFISLLSAYLFAEMWFGILFTILVEIFPLNMRSTAIALFIFVMNNLASCGQLLVPALEPHLGLRTTLYVTYAGFYGLCSLFFLLTQILIWKRQVDKNVDPTVAIYKVTEDIGEKI